MKEHKMNMKLLLYVAVVLIVMIVPVQTFAQGDGASGSIQAYLDAALPPSEGRRIVLDPIRGVITVVDTAENQQLAAQLIKLWDVGPKQILIETIFEEISMTDLYEIGVEWYWYRRGLTGGKARDIVIGRDSSDYNDTSNSNEGIQWEDALGNVFPTTSTGLDLLLSRTTFGGSYLRPRLHAL